MPSNSPFAPYVLAAPHTLAAVLDAPVSAPAGFTAPILSGGTVTISGGYVYHKFTTNDVLYVYASGTVDWILVGGGAAGGFWGGGGGGGKVLTGAGVSLSVGSYPIVIGAGGSPSADINTKGGNGTASTFNGNSATGGGGGGSQNTRPGAAGGQGGGGAYDSSGTGGTGEQFNGGAASSGQGTGGGGGGSAAGSNASGNTGGNGGAGYLWLDGNRYAGGGGGSARGDDPSPVAGTGGSGGGGNGGNAVAGSNATANTGGGGGGGGRSAGAVNFAGGSGGSGVFIVRYATTDLLAGLYATGGTITVDGNLIRHTITASGNFALASKGLLALTDGLVVGGGGGAGGGQSSVAYPAGGAGGEVNVLGATNITGTQAITIGPGGADNPVQNGAAGTNGTSTVFGTINTATGGEAGGVDGVGEGGDNIDFVGGNKSGLNAGGGGGAGGAGSGMNGGAGLEWPASSGTFYAGGGSGGPSGTNGSGSTGANSGHGSKWDGPGSASGVVIVRYAPGSFQPGHPAGFSVQSWWDPTAGVTATAGAVSQWNDQTAHANHYVQATGANQPLNNSVTTPNGLAAIAFDGSNDYMDGSNFDIVVSGKKVTFFGVMKWDATGTGRCIACATRSGGSTLQSMQFEINPTNTQISWGTGASGFATFNFNERVFSTPSNTNWHRFILTMDSTDSWHCWVDGVELSTSGGGGGGTMAASSFLSTDSSAWKPTIGRRPDPFYADANVSFHGYLSEVLNSTDRALLDNWMKAKTGV